MKINWGATGVGALVAEITQIAAAFGWVAVYSYLINPGSRWRRTTHMPRRRPVGFHSRRAPIFDAASRWIARSRPTALALFGIFLVVDGALLVGMMESWTGAPAADRTRYLSKLCACALGGRH